MPTVAVLGTGIMGAAMARRLTEIGMRVRVWNRTREKAEPLGEAGADIAESPRLAADGADVILTMLSDGAAVEDVMASPDGALMGARAGTLWLQMSTVGVADCARLQQLAQHRLAFVDAPVLGTREPAERGELTILASGSRAIVDRGRSVFAAVGRKTLWVGEAGAGTRLKLAANAWVAGLIGALGETIALAEALGVDPRAFLDAIKGGPLDSAYAQTKGKAVIERAYPPSFPLRLAHKDLGLILEAAHGQGLALPIVSAVESLVARAIEKGRGEEDIAAIAEGLERRR
jgi:3-hydroxyisobutyrate dehydrogenase